MGGITARAIIAARDEGGSFASIWEFTERVDPQVANRRALEALIRCGALDSTDATRKGMLDVLDSALSWGGREQADRIAGQGSIFDLGADAGTEAPRRHPDIPAAEFDKSELLALEKETLGLYVSEHPLSSVREQLRRKVDCSLAELDTRRDGEFVTVGGIVGALKHLTTKKGEPMVFMRLDDLTGSTEIVIFNSVLAAARELLASDAIIVVRGRVDHKEGETKMIAMEVTAFEASPERRQVELRIDATRAHAGLVRDLAALVRDYPGEAAVVLSLQTSGGPKRLALGPAYKVQPVADFFAEVKALLGEAAIV